MSKRQRIHNLWLILAAYGVWFAMFSGLEEISNGKYWKAGLSLLLGTITYVIIEKQLES